VKQQPAIEVRANRLGGIGGAEWHHAYIVYTDENGKQCFLRGGPTPTDPPPAMPISELSGGASRSSAIQSQQASTSGLSQGSSPNSASVSDKTPSGPYGTISTETRYLDKSPGAVLPVDYHPDQSYKSVVISQGPQCEGQFQQMCQEMQSIQGSNTRYSPLGPNSNTCVGQSLRSAGVAAKLPEGVWAPGFEQSIDTARITREQREAVCRDGNHETHPPGEHHVETASDIKSAERRSLKDQMRESSSSSKDRMHEVPGRNI
jgi:hypothetical protein